MMDAKRWQEMSDDTRSLNPELNPARRPTATPQPVQAQTVAKRTKGPQAANSGSEVKVNDDTVAIVLYGERPLSWNLYWSGMHFSERSKEKSRVKELVQLALFDAGYNKRPFGFVVCIQLNIFMVHPVYDPDNAAMKPYIDALQGFLITKDDHRYVRAVLPVVKKVKENPRVEIIVGSLEWEKYLP